MLLAIDTATANASLALYDDRQVWAERTWFAGRSHTTELLPAIDAMCTQVNVAPADLLGVAVAIGPGSFTGMRVGLAAAKGLALALRVPIVGIATLDAMAEPFRWQDRPVYAVVHAGRGRFAVARYGHAGGAWGREGEYRLVTPAGLPVRGGEPVIYAGELDDEARSALRETMGERAVIASPAHAVRRAAMLAEMAWPRIVRREGDDIASLAPIYLHTLQEQEPVRE